MSTQNFSQKPLDLEPWVEASKADPVRYRQRQVTHILLHAVARTPVLRDTLCLKGGTLMSAFYGSLRQTGDVDFSASGDPEPFATELRPVLDQALAAAAADLGYLDLEMRVQRCIPQPRDFANATAPALQMTIGIATRNTNAAKRLAAGQATEVLGVDVSFKEPVINLQVLTVSAEASGPTVLAYSTEELIAEKLRALVQQPSRNRYRRQDVYDICWLIENVTLDASSPARILAAFREKSDAREVTATIDTLDDPEIARRARAEWNTMALEIGTVPDFDALFATVRTFYRNLPW